jgi:hypothetical protein
MTVQQQKVMTGGDKPSTEKKGIWFVVKMVKDHRCPATVSGDPSPLQTGDGTL